MKNLAVVIGTSDSHSFLWKDWWYYFNKNWKYNYPIYFLNEKKDIDFSIKQIKVNIPNINLWTKRIRKSIEQIPEDNIFWLLEDFFITKSFKKNEFENIYDFFIRINADSLRIDSVESIHTTSYNTKFKINGTLIEKLDQHSRYLISYLPNIWKKSFLLECLKVDESPWESEIKGSQRIEGKDYDIYSYLRPNWFGNACRQGKLTQEGKKLVDNRK